MAKTRAGKKIVSVKPHNRKINGIVRVRRHKRSTQD